MTGGRPLVRRRALMPRPRPRIPSCAHFQRNQAHPHALCRFRVKESNCTANSSALFGRSGNERSARKAVFARCGKAAPPSTRKTLQREGRKRRSGEQERAAVGSQCRFGPMREVQLLPHRAKTAIVPGISVQRRETRRIPAQQKAKGGPERPPCLEGYSVCHRIVANGPNVPA